MDIGRLLKSVGGAVLKNVPMGGMIYDIADSVLDEALPDDITGDELTAKLQKLPPEQYERIMGKKIDADLAKYQSWTDLRKSMDLKSPASTARSVVTATFGIGIMLIILIFTYVFARNYIDHGTFPTVDVILVTYGIPMIVVLTSFGIKSDKFLDAILTAALKRMK